MTDWTELRRGVCVVAAAGADGLHARPCQHRLSALSDPAVRPHHSRRDTLLYSRPLIRLLTGTPTYLPACLPACQPACLL